MGARDLFSNLIVSEGLIDEITAAENRRAVASDDLRQRERAAHQYDIDRAREDRARESNAVRSAYEEGREDQKKQDYEERAGIRDLVNALNSTMLERDTLLRKIDSLEDRIAVAQGRGNATMELAQSQMRDPNFYDITVAKFLNKFQTFKKRCTGYIDGRYDDLPKWCYDEYRRASVGVNGDIIDRAYVDEDLHRRTPELRRELMRARGEAHSAFDAIPAQPPEGASISIDFDKARDAMRKLDEVIRREDLRLEQNLSDYLYERELTTEFIPGFGMGTGLRCRNGKPKFESFDADDPKERYNPKQPVVKEDPAKRVQAPEDAEATKPADFSQVPDDAVEARPDDGGPELG